MNHPCFKWLVAAVFLLFSISGFAKTPATYGAWPSVIKAEVLTKSAREITDVCLDGETIYWVELRPEQQGRHFIMKCEPGCAAIDVFNDGSGFDVCTRAHGYGGGALLVVEGTVYFFTTHDHSLWYAPKGQIPRQLTASDKNLTLTDFCFDEKRNRLIAVEEKKTGGDTINRIVAVDLEFGDITPLIQGDDFYSNPRVSPDGEQLCWLSWKHPSMPWDHTRLKVSGFDSNGEPIDICLVAGATEESVFQPCWASGSTLYYVSDKTGWWNLYSFDSSSTKQLITMEAEFGVPQWQFGYSTFGLCSDNTIISAYNTKGIWHLGRLSSGANALTEVANPYTCLSYIKVTDEKVYAVAGSGNEKTALISIDICTGSSTIIRECSEFDLPPGYESEPKAIEFESGDSTAYAIYYPPANPDYEGTADTLPPLLVVSHGGPTSAAEAKLDPAYLYWTSRGFAICDVNYRGSSGYGTAYRNLLKQQWGVFDVEDCTNAALQLAQQGKVDRNHLIVRGRSAGGFTTLACLTSGQEVFCCGTSCCGVSDLKLLTKGTHKFESRYLDSLLGKLPDAEAIYTERSPITYIERISCPVLLHQGKKDPIVPLDQAQAILDGLRGRSAPVAHIFFEGENHHIEKAANIIRLFESEYIFYSQVLGFELPDNENITPLEIENLMPIFPSAN